MYKFNNKLVVRDGDKSMFSLDEMEIYEFNEVGFNAIMIVKEAGESGVSFQDWKEKALQLPDFVDEDVEEFWNGLIQYGIIVEA